MWRDIRRDWRTWAPFVLALAALLANVALAGAGLSGLATLALAAIPVFLGIGFIGVAPWAEFSPSVAWPFSERLLVWVVRGLGLMLVLLGAWLAVASVSWS